MRIFLVAAIFKSLLLKMAATVMTVEFGTIHHYSSLEENSDACLCNLWTDIKINWTLCKLWHFGLKYACFRQQHEYKLASSPLYACLTKIDDFFIFRRNFWIFLFVICKLVISFYLINDFYPKENFKILSNAPLRIISFYMFNKYLNESNPKLEYSDSEIRPYV